jgi:selenocysteine lyase/cysteine desulfurase
MENSPEAFLASLTRLITSKTKVVSISAVHWCTGMPLTVDAVGALCRDRGIYLVVDGAQGVGMQPLHVKKAGIDFMAFSAWKWLMGPLGLGVLYVSRDRIESLKPIFIGTESVIRDQEYLPYKTDLKPSADRFTFSTANFMDWVYFLAALEFLETIGFEKVRQRIYQLGRHLSQGLREAGYRVFSDHFPAHPTGITVCEKQAVSSRAIMQRLKTCGIVAAERLGRVRFSPHIYILPQQLDRVVDVLADM